MPEPRKVLAGRSASDHKTKTFFELLTHRRKAYRTARDQQSKTAARGCWVTPIKAPPDVAKAVQTDRMNHAGLWIAGTGKAKRNAVGCTIRLSKTAHRKRSIKVRKTTDRDFSVFVILYNQRGECAIGKAKSSELYTSSGTMILVRFQSLLLLSNSF